VNRWLALITLFERVLISVLARLPDPPAESELILDFCAVQDILLLNEQADAAAFGSTRNTTDHQSFATRPIDSPSAFRAEQRRQWRTVTCT
jgi:hypothetical protein